MKILTKNCVVCDKKFAKPYYCGMPEWLRRKYCSRACINKGRVPVNYYLKPIPCLTCKKEFKPTHKVTKYCSKICTLTIFRKGHRPWHDGTKGLGIKKQRKWTVEERKQIADRFRGEKSHLWKGGVSSENYKLRRNAEYKEFRKQVYERDDYTCQKCGDNKGGNLQVHHIKSWALYPKLRLEVSNGQTLCISCHIQTDTYAKNFRKGSTS